MEVIAGLLLLVLLLGQGVSPGQVSRAVERSIREALPSAQTVDVEVRAASRSKLMAGRLDEVVIRIEDYDLAELGGLRIVLSDKPPAREGHVRRLVVVGTSGRLPISEGRGLPAANAGTGALEVALVRLEFEDVAFDMAQIVGGAASIAIHRVGRTRATVVLSETALNAGLGDRLLALRDPSISLDEPDVVRVQGTLDSIVPIPLEVTGRLAIQRSTRIVLIEPKVNVMGVALPDSIVRDLVQTTNPLLDLRRWNGLPVSIRLGQVTVHGDTIVAEGEIRLLRQRVPGAGIPSDRPSNAASGGGTDR